MVVKPSYHYIGLLYWYYIENTSRKFWKLQNWKEKCNEPFQMLFQIDDINRWLSARLQ